MELIKVVTKKLTRNRTKEDNRICELVFCPSDSRPTFEVKVTGDSVSTHTGFL